MAEHASIEAAQSGGGQSLEAAHQALRADPALQFRFQEFIPPEPPPAWLQQFARFLQAIAPVLQWVFWIGVFAIAAAIVVIVVREIIRRLPEKWRWTRKARPAAPAPAFRPSVVRARALLEEADRLANEGRYSKAARVLLHRTIEDIEQSFALTIGPALTSREIARLEPLSPRGRDVFSGIAQAVETSLFGARPLDAQRFAECRAAYAAFAFDGRRG